MKVTLHLDEWLVIKFGSDYLTLDGQLNLEQSLSTRSANFHGWANSSSCVFALKWAAIYTKMEVDDIVLKIENTNRWLT